jgi:hypothetical protein
MARYLFAIHDLPSAIQLTRVAGAAGGCGGGEHGKKFARFQFSVFREEHVERVVGAPVN